MLFWHHGRAPLSLLLHRALVDESHDKVNLIWACGVVVIHGSHTSLASDVCLQNLLADMHYVYLLKISGIKNKDYYIGYTSDLKKRLVRHQNGEVKTTKGRNPKLIYYEAYQDKYVALKREKGIKKSGSVYMSLMKRLQLK